MKIRTTTTFFGRTATTVFFWGGQAHQPKMAQLTSLAEQCQEWNYQADGKTWHLAILFSQSGWHNRLRNSQFWFNTSSILLTSLLCLYRSSVAIMVMASATCSRCETLLTQLQVLDICYKHKPFFGHRNVKEANLSNPSNSKSQRKSLKRNLKRNSLTWSGLCFSSISLTTMLP